MEKYTRIKHIGKGNMGACFLMRNNEDGKHYVMKQIDLANLSKRERRQALNEARVLSSLKHPNIINYVDSFLARRSDHLCIVMEYAEAGDIASRLKTCRGHLRENVILDWLIQICLAVNAVHQKHILHRDIKAQNIFITSQGIIKIGDFGIARELNNTFDQAHTFVGTPYYLSPELVQERPYDTRSDIWALGVVLYEMMALKHPFNANDMKSLMTKIVRVHYDPPPSYYSSELREIVQKVLVKDPRQRMSLGAILSLPVIRRRLGQWVSGNAGVPQHYLDQMLRHKLLPGYARLEKGEREVKEPVEPEPEEAPLPKVAQPKRVGSSDTFAQQHEALRKNLANPSVYSPSPSSRYGKAGYKPGPGVGHNPEPPDALRQREIMKERELQGVIGNYHRAYNPHLVRPHNRSPTTGNSMATPAANLPKIAPHGFRAPLPPSRLSDKFAMKPSPAVNPPYLQGYPQKRPAPPILGAVSHMKFVRPP